MKLPLHLPYPDATTVDDATGEIIAECPDAETAARLVAIVNAAYEVAQADGGSVFIWRAAMEELTKAVQG